MELLQAGAFQRDVTEQLRYAAQEAGLKLLPVDIPVSVRNDFVIANAMIAPPDGTRPEYAEKLFLMYLSLPKEHEMSDRVPEGYYIVERVKDSPNPRAQLVNMEGKEVLEVPLNIIRTELPPNSYQWSGGEGPKLYSQAMIEQSHATLYRDVVLQGHGIICYPGVWYWTWVVIVIVLA